MADNPQSTPAAWYPDPQNPSQLRYWDGSAWTSHFHPIPQSPPAGAAPDQGVEEGPGAQQPESGKDSERREESAFGATPPRAEEPSRAGTQGQGMYGPAPSQSPAPSQGEAPPQKQAPSQSQAPSPGRPDSFAGRDERFSEPSPWSGQAPTQSQSYPGRQPSFGEPGGYRPPTPQTPSGQSAPFGGPPQGGYAPLQGTPVPSQRTSTSGLGGFKKVMQEATDSSLSAWLKVKAWATLASPALILLALAALAFPAARVTDPTTSGNLYFFQGTDGWMALGAYLIALGLVIAWILTGQRWANIAAGAVGIIAGIVGIGIAVNVIANSGEFFGVTISAGLGVWLSLAFGIFVIAASVIVVIPGGKPQQSPPQFGPPPTQQAPRL